MEEICSKCNGTGRIKDSSGYHVCFDCLVSGKLDTYNKEIKSSVNSEKPILRWGEKRELSFDKN